jgi:hypothetical protein
LWVDFSPHLPQHSCFPLARGGNRTPSPASPDLPQCRFAPGGGNEMTSPASLDLPQHSLRSLGERICCLTVR